MKHIAVLILFVEIFLIAFVGITLTNILAITVRCFSDGFGTFTSMLTSLPYALYILVGIIISAAFTFVFARKR